MSPRDKPFRWTKRSERAAALVAEDRLTDEAIAEKVGIAKRTLERWKDAPDFAARVAEHVERFRVVVRSRGIAVIENRVQALQERWDLMKQIIRERAQAPEMAEVPGGSTGLLVRQIKLVKVYGSDEDEPPGDDEATEGETLHSLKLSVPVEEFVLDTGLLRELREHEKQAAQELQQWTEKRDLTSDGKPLAPQTVTIYIPDNGRDTGDTASAGSAGDVSLDAG